MYYSLQQPVSVLLVKLASFPPSQLQMLPADLKRKKTITGKHYPVPWEKNWHLTNLHTQIFHFKMIIPNAGLKMENKLRSPEGCKHLSQLNY